MEMLSFNRRDLIKKIGLLASVGACPSLAFASMDSTLEAKINQFVQSERKRGRVASNERTAWSVYDFSKGKKVVSINETIPLQSASMVKPFVALAYFYLNTTNPKKYPYTNAIRNHMEAMLVSSSNSATNYLMKKCGARLCTKTGAKSS